VTEPRAAGVVIRSAAASDRARRGFRIRVIRPGAVDEARRTLKPELPTIGDHGIPIRHEIELERTIEPD
jgi:hypothetical protein